MSKIKTTEQTFKTMAELYKMSMPTFRKNINSIRQKLDDIAGRKLYRRLSPKQVELILDHMGEP